MKKAIAALIIISTGNAFAHVSQASAQSHASEHLLLAIFLIPLVWFLVRKVLK